ncbi:MAG: hypothetical protein WC797_03450 [Candidatus Paceibacterota bacterium]|jgi:hypothetical protein
MVKGLKNLYKEEAKTAPNFLVKSIDMAVLSESRRLAKKRLAVSLIGGIVSVFAEFIAIYVVATSAIYSGLVGYLSLVMSDGVLLVAHWREALTSIVEALPVLETAAAVFVFGLVIISINSLLKNIKILSFNFSK